MGCIIRLLITLRRDINFVPECKAATCESDREGPLQRGRSPVTVLRGASCALCWLCQAVSGQVSTAWAWAGIIHRLLLASLWQQYTNKPQIRLLLRMTLNSPKGSKLINASPFRCNPSLRNLRGNNLECERDFWLCYLQLRVRSVCVPVCP